MLQMKEKEKQVIKDKFTVSLIVIYNTMQNVCLITFKEIVMECVFKVFYLCIDIYIIYTV